MGEIKLYVSWWKGIPETDERWEEGDRPGVVTEAETGKPIVFMSREEAEQDIIDTTAPEERDEYEVRPATLTVEVSK